MAGALQSGTISAAFVVQPYITEMEAKGDRKLVDLMSGSFLTFPLEGWMTNTYYTQHDPRTLAAFQRAIVKAQATAAKDPTLVRNLLIKNTKGMSAGVANAMSLRTFSDTVTAAQLNGVIDSMQRLGAFPKPLNFTAASLIVPLPSGT
jgi:NitT/TauT family transport system substrate-binding protein